jgi:hypothetical protein
MKFSKVMGIFVATGMLMGGGTMAYAGDLCRNVKLQFKNERPVRIKVHKIEYFNTVNNKTQTEDVNVECNAGATCTTSGQDLRDSEGIKLTKFVFYFYDRESDGDWSKTSRKTQEKEPVDQICRADRQYSGNPLWTINPG